MEEPSPTFCCDICRDVLKVATTACCEGHAFCKGCLKPSVQVCPTCRGIIQKTNCLPLQNIIETLQVKCPNQAEAEGEESGENEAEQPPTKSRRRSKSSRSSPSNKKSSSCCDWTGPLSELDKHKTSCKLELVPCTNEGCKEKIPRRNMKKHLAVCDHRLSRCNKCKQNVPHHTLTDHKCPKEMTACPYCDKRMLRQELLGRGAPDYMPVGWCVHMEAYAPTDEESEGHYTVCPKVPLGCEFHNQGCTKRILREDLARHHAEDAQAHARLIAMDFEEIPGKLEDKLSREHVTINFAVSIHYLGSMRNYPNIKSDMCICAGRNVRIKLYQCRNEAKPIQVGIICSGTSLSNAYNEIIKIYDVNIRVLATDPGNDDEAEPFPSIRNGIVASGPLFAERESYDESVFKTNIPYYGSDPNPNHSFMTGAHLEKIASMVGGPAVYIVASFSMRKRHMKKCGVYTTSSPCASPSHEENYSEEESDY